VGARLIHVSTDYVFAGDAREPYETDAPTGPRNVYGRSKLAGELAVRAELREATIVRTAWVYSGVGSDFVATMLGRARAGATARVVADRVGSPTYAGDLAAALLELAGRDPIPGMLHATGGGWASWFELAQAVYVAAGADPELVAPCPAADYPTPARRPDHSVLSDRSWHAAGLTPLPPWRDALRRAVASVGSPA
jgi:dTDP-4-dehydrorhamnose reductase